MKIIPSTWRRLGLMLALATAAALTGCGSDSKDDSDDDDDDSTATEIKYSDISAIVTESCATSGCHGGTQVPELKTGGEAYFKANKSTLKARIDSTSPAIVMPQPNTTEATAFSAADKALVLKYLAQ
jgi:hypothetical protein